MSISNLEISNVSNHEFNHNLDLESEMTDKYEAELRYIRKILGNLAFQSILQTFIQSSYAIKSVNLYIQNNQNNLWLALVLIILIFSTFILRKKIGYCFATYIIIICVSIFFAFVRTWIFILLSCFQSLYRFSLFIYISKKKKFIDLEILILFLIHMLVLVIITFIFGNYLILFYCCLSFLISSTMFLLSIAEFTNYNEDFFNIDAKFNLEFKILLRCIIIPHNLLLVLMQYSKLI